ncbi:hypothetical protein NC651_029874 [Populus alba x Populus x berolinensis]|nr:hypothetical protein NC651_029874 [Populus alba x Populus x berolinensis]
MGAALRSPQVGESTSKFVVEGAAQAAAPLKRKQLPCSKFAPDTEDVAEDDSGKSIG